MPTNRISSLEISIKTKNPIDKIDRYHEYLHEEEEIDCCIIENSHKMFITSKGRQSFIDKIYIKEGRKAYWDALYDPLKIILPIISIAIAVLALYLNSSSSKKIDTFKSELDSLKGKILTTTYTTKAPKNSTTCNISFV